MNQLYIQIYIYPLTLFRFFSHRSHLSVFSKVPCAIQQVLISNSLFINEETEA